MGNIATAAKVFKNGDVVQVRSGGPRMTVVETSPGIDPFHMSKIVVVTWFDKTTKRMRSDEVPENALEDAAPVLGEKNE